MLRFLKYSNKQKNFYRNFCFEKNKVEVGKILEQDTVIKQDENYLNLRKLAVEKINKSYLKKLNSITPWRKKYEDKLSRRKLPVPYSLTGFGDCSPNTRIWVQQIKNKLIDLYKNQEEENYLEDLPVALNYMLQKFPDDLDEKYKPVVEKFNIKKEKSLNKHIAQKEKILEQTFQLPFNFSEIIKESSNIKEYKDKDKEILDKDYENYLKHHDLLQFMANKFQKISSTEISGELTAFTNALWQRDYGSENPEIKPSNIPCYGCGSNLHCTSSNIPGYIPYESFIDSSDIDLKKKLCQRCEFLQKYNVSLNINVNEIEYEKIISELKHKPGLILLMVDLTDFPCSINPKILDLIGKHDFIYIVGNKVDILPRDGEGFLSRYKDALLDNLNLKIKISKNNVFLISAKTGFGLENLITNIFKNYNGKGDIYLVGCTNVGKSTLFNSLIQSDLCKLRQFDLIQRATTSLWPGTTLNLLKFPLRKIQEYELELRNRRLVYTSKRQHLIEKDLRKSLKYQDINKSVVRLEDKISSSFIKEIPFSFDSNHPFSKLTKKMKPFDDTHPAFNDSKYFYDTPGIIHKDQILSLLTTEELLRTLPRKTIKPRTFTMQPFQTLFLAGLGRLDLVNSKNSIMVTVFASDYLPVHIVDLEHSFEFYELYLKTDMFSVPIGDERRLKSWPSLISKDFYIYNKYNVSDFNKNISICDVVFSSAGWVALTLPIECECNIKVFTPEGRGIYLRKPSILPYAVKLKGPKINGTPCFEPHREYIHSINEEENYKLKSLQREKYKIPSRKRSPKLETTFKLLK